MKKVMTAFLLMPLVADAMQKDVRWHASDHTAIPTVVAISQTSVRTMTEQTPSDSLSNDPMVLAPKNSRDDLIDGATPEEFLEQFRDMRYFHLSCAPMKALLVTALKYGLLHGHELGTKPSKAIEPAHILHRAQNKVATLIQRVCAKEGFLANVNCISESVTEKFDEVFAQKPLVLRKYSGKNNRPTALTSPEMITNVCYLYTILENFDAFTGTSLKDMALGEHAVAIRLCQKAKDLLIKDGVEKQNYIDLRKAFVVEGDDQKGLETEGNKASKIAITLLRDL